MKRKIEEQCGYRGRRCHTSAEYVRYLLFMNIKKLKKKLNRKKKEKRRSHLGSGRCRGCAEYVR